MTRETLRQLAQAILGGHGSWDALQDACIEYDIFKTILTAA